MCLGFKFSSAESLILMMTKENFAFPNHVLQRHFCRRCCRGSAGELCMCDMSDHLYRTIRRCCRHKPEFPTTKTGKGNLKAGVKFLLKHGLDDAEPWSGAQFHCFIYEALLPHVVEPRPRVIDTGTSRKFRMKPVLDKTLV